MNTPSRYEQEQIDDIVRFYTSSGLLPGIRLTGEEYARARASIATWSLDGLVCARTLDRRPAIVLVRDDDGPGSGPFRNEPWLVGGKWDMVTPWKAFVRGKVAHEIFGGVLPRVVYDKTTSPSDLRPDRDHSHYLVLHSGDDLSRLHPYVRDVIQLSGWLP